MLARPAIIVVLRVTRSSGVAAALVGAIVAFSAGVAAEGGTLSSTEAMMLDGNFALSTTGTGHGAHLTADTPASLTVRAPYGVLHEREWNTTIARSPISSHEQDTKVTERRVPLSNIQSVSWPSAPGLRVSIVLAQADMVVQQHTARVTALAQAYTAPDPNHGLAVDDASAPYDALLHNVLKVEISTNGTVSGTGDGIIAVWGSELRVTTQHGQYTARSGWSNYTMADTLPGDVWFQTRRIAWVEFADAEVTSNVPENSLLYTPLAPVRLVGQASMDNAVGKVSWSQSTLQANGQDIVVRGNLTITPSTNPGPVRGTNIEDSNVPFRTQKWSVSGTINSATIVGIQFKDPSFAGPTTTVTAGLLATFLAAAAGVRLWPEILAALHTGRRHPPPSLGTTRYAIYQFVLGHAGSTAREASDALQIGKTTAKYHLDRMVDGGILNVRSDNRALRYFANEDAALTNEAAIVALVRHPTAYKLVKAIVRSPGSTQTEMAIRTGLPRSTVSFHLQRLTKNEAVWIEHQGDYAMKHYHPTKRLHGVLARIGQPVTASSEPNPVEA